MRAAIPHFRYPCIVAVDADLSIGLVFIGEAVRRLEEGYDVVAGSKAMGAQQRHMFRVLAGDVFVWLLRRGLRLPCHDVSIGAKAYRLETLKRYGHLIGRGSNYVLDIVMRAHEDGLRLAEIPVVCDDTRQGRFNLLQEGIYRFPHLFYLIGRRIAYGIVGRRLAPQPTPPPVG